MGSTRTSILKILRNANSFVSVLRSSRVALPWTAEMDAKTTRDLALLAVLSLFCAGFAWSWGYVILSSVFFALGIVAALGIPQTGADMGQLILKSANASRSSGEWSDDDYDVVAEGIVVGRIMKATAAAPLASVEA